MRNTIVLLVLFLMGFGGCTYDDEENKCDHQPVGCITVDTLLGKVNIKITLNSLNQEIPVTLYQGTVESGTIIAVDTLDSLKHAFALKSGGYYSIKAKYRHYVHDTLVSVFSVDGEELKSSSSDYCEGPCYRPGELELDATLDTTLFNAKKVRKTVASVAPSAKHTSNRRIWQP